MKISDKYIAVMVGHFQQIFEKIQDALITFTINLLYKWQQISKFKCSSFRLAVVFTQSIEARC